jgi:hypothetical protein
MRPAKLAAAPAGQAGPALAEPRTLGAAYERCRQLHARHGRTYYLATLLLPRWNWRHVHALYGFTRHADELVDQLASALDGRGRAAALTAWGERLFAGLQGSPDRSTGAPPWGSLRGPRCCRPCCTPCGPSAWTRPTSSGSWPRWPWT